MIKEIDIYKSPIVGSMIPDGFLHFACVVTTTDGKKTFVEYGTAPNFSQLNINKRDIHHTEKWIAGCSWATPEISWSSFKSWCEDTTYMTAWCVLPTYKAQLNCQVFCQKIAEKYMPRSCYDAVTAQKDLGKYASYVGDNIVGQAANIVTGTAAGIVSVGNDLYNGKPVDAVYKVASGVGSGLSIAGEAITSTASNMFSGVGKLFGY